MAFVHCIMGVKMQSFVYIRIIIVFILLGFCLVVWFPAISLPLSDKSEYLTVSFLDVGQGDAIHVKTPDGYELLIDGGPSSGVLRELSLSRSFFDRTIDVVIATHPDKDHIAGLIDVLDRYKVGWIIQTNTKNETPVSRAFSEAVNNEDATVVAAWTGQVFKLGASTTVKILSPEGDTTDWNSNTSSIIVQVVYGDTEFMLTGDAPQSIEEYLAGKYGNVLESEVLKLGHHGSKTSSAESFLDFVDPKFAVVSAGSDNRYGHPNQEVIERVEDRKVSILSTAEIGTVVFQSNGEEVWLVE